MPNVFNEVLVLLSNLTCFELIFEVLRRCCALLGHQLCGSLPYGASPKAGMRAQM